MAKIVREQSSYDKAKVNCLNEVTRIAGALIDNRHFGKLVFHYQNGTIVHVTIEDGVKLDGSQKLQDAIKKFDALSE